MVACVSKYRIVVCGQDSTASVVDPHDVISTSNRIFECVLKALRCMNEGGSKLTYRLVTLDFIPPNINIFLAYISYYLEHFLNSRKEKIYHISLVIPSPFTLITMSPMSCGFYNEWVEICNPTKL